MPRTLRGANSRQTAFFRRREDGKKGSPAQGTQEDPQTQDPQAEEEAPVSNVAPTSLEGLMKPELKEKAASLGLSVGGTKVELIARITEATS